MATIGNIIFENQRGQEIEWSTHGGKYELRLMTIVPRLLNALPQIDSSSNLVTDCFAKKLLI